MQYFDPRGKEISDDTIWRWHANVLSELEDDYLTDAEKNFIVANIATGAEGANGAETILTNRRKRAYFKHTYMQTFKRSAEFLFKGNPHPVILDLGCGIGTQSLYFAMMGARVVSLDLNAGSLEILKRRVSFYEDTIAKEKLDISVHCEDAFKFDYTSVPPLDGLHSMFAFNIIQPSSKLISLIVPHMSNTAKFAIIDGNRTSWVGRYVPSRKRDVLSPKEMDENLKGHGFTISAHRGGVAIPPSVWPFDFLGLITGLDALLCSSWFFAISHHILAERTS